MVDYDNSYTVKPLKITDRANFLFVFTLLPYQILGKPLILTAKTSMYALDIQCFVHSREGHHSVILWPTSNSIFLLQSKSKSGDLERENTRLRRELEQHNQYQIKTHKALATHASDLMSLRSKYLDVQTELERVSIELQILKLHHCLLSA